MDIRGPLLRALLRAVQPLRPHQAPHLRGTDQRVASTTLDWVPPHAWYGPARAIPLEGPDHYRAQAYV